MEYPKEIRQAQIYYDQSCVDDELVRNEKDVNVMSVFEYLVTIVLEWMAVMQVAHYPYWSDQVCVDGYWFDFASVSESVSVSDASVLLLLCLYSVGFV